eukprot:gnl/TRDRNA2_/TRDRNA2_176821_c0_seq1.p1 gnl/TRDRNA2_/TRDRNA2_176821_c0~~gnl/TRDRNA2_/TRDRNA2_176821_c0_seq1.p1  ORF type:complete len:590 (+),score=94.50 gnl/TRDRNA2_/TRDRNA2_176821_c0_seq1:86-1855(+)
MPHPRIPLAPMDQPNAFTSTASKSLVFPSSPSKAAGNASKSITGCASKSVTGSMSMAPPKRMLSRVAAGHAAKGGDAICAADHGEDGKPRTILKKLDEIELEAYTSLSTEYAEDPVHDFVPEFFGVRKDGDGKFIRISNILHDFSQPKVMDIKLGVRTYLESECDNPKLRPDLYEKMEKMYPHEVTSSEREVKAITKHRWMSVRDSNSTIGSLGYRIDGVAGYRRKARQEIDDELTAVRSSDDTCRILRAFAEAAATDDGEMSGGVDGHHIATELIEQLRRMSEVLKTSPFVSGREFIGSSILVVADATGRTGVFWIDFAKTHAVPEGMAVTHRDLWEPGNHEDGIVLGLENLINSLSSVSQILDSGMGRLSDGSPAHPSRRRRIAQSLGRVGQKLGLRPRKAHTPSAEIFSDMSLLSALPGLTGVVAEENGRIWAAGARVVATVGTAAAGAAAGAVAAAGAAAEGVTVVVDAGGEVVKVVGTTAVEVTAAGVAGVAAAGEAVAGVVERGASEAHHLARQGTELARHGTKTLQRAGSRGFSAAAKPASRIGSAVAFGATFRPWGCGRSGMLKQMAREEAEDHQNNLACA